MKINNFVMNIKTSNTLKLIKIIDVNITNLIGEGKLRDSMRVEMKGFNN